MATFVAASRLPLAVVQSTGPRPEHHTLSFWMHRVLAELDKLRSAPDADTVHDLRVAIRRCRSLATVMEEVDPHPAWPQMRKAARKLFRGLGEVRDAQVLEDWIKQLAAEDDPLRAQLLASLQSAEKERTEAALRIAAKFHTQKWLDLDHQLHRRFRFVPAASLAAECLALERFEEARELHSLALRTEKPKPWHALRIGLKKFRYTVEGFLPEHHAAWSKNLKRLQDLLGDIHDLDVLLEKLDDPQIPVASAAPWRAKIAHERHERVETYRRLTLGRTSLWNEWRHNLPHNGRLAAAVTARLRATARAADPHPRRTSQESRIALRIFDILRRQKAASVFLADSTLRILQAAAQLHGFSSVGDRTLSLKAVRKLLTGLAIPPGWSTDHWDLMAWAIRFHRGAEPRQKNGFAKLDEEEQTVVRAAAGVLRLARVLRKTGISTSVGLRSEKSADAFVLRVPGLADTAETAGRLAVAKHLLESVLPKPLILKSVPKPEKVVAVAAEPASELPALPVASD